MEPAQRVKDPAAARERGEDKAVADARVDSERAPVETVCALVVEARFPTSKERHVTSRSAPIAGPA